MELTCLRWIFSDEKEARREEEDPCTGAPLWLAVYGTTII